MAIKKELTGYKVVVWVDKPWVLAERVPDRWRESAHDLAAAVRRHVDGIDHIDVEADLDLVCEFCGSAWGERDELYNGGCCARDCEEEDKRAAEIEAVRP
jgi:hypothetical protein